MEDSDPIDEAEVLLKHPLMVKISNLCYRLTNVKLTGVFPGDKGWAQFSPRGETKMPEFCRMIHSAPDGAKHCSMCHVLMTVAACSTGSTEQKCHAGISVMVHPIKSEDTDQPQALLSSCTFTSRARSRAWKDAMARGKKLNIDIADLKKAFFKLPVLTPEQTRTVTELMDIAGEAVKEIRYNISLQAKVTRAHKHIQMRSLAGAAVADKLRVFGSEAFLKKRRRSQDDSIPAVINVVRETVAKRPDFHFNVADLAAAARMTPNHFSAIFHRHCGQTFSDFVTQTRLERAKELLKDFTLNISEVASRAGFDDPGYFARRFRQAIGCTPREWRDRLSA